MAAEAGWHISRYNISAKEPSTGKTLIANLLRGSCHAYSPLELFLMSALDEIDENHPAIIPLAKRGVICNFDEVAALEAASDILERLFADSLQDLVAHVPPPSSELPLPILIRC